MLLIEDDVVSGVSLELVIAALRAHRPASIAVYLGRRVDGQCPENVPVGLEILVAESYLDPTDQPRHEAEFIREFGADVAEPNNAGERG